ncbi:MAG TPA: hypothetical protein PKL60_04425, partial [Anaerolineaceae bacterium]|nr:hypothetical protein [Anaerolineaceae bacterium]
GQRLVIRTGVQPPLTPTPLGAQPTSLTPLPLPSATPTRTPTRTPIPSPTPTATPQSPLAAFWRGNLSGALLTGALGMLLGAGLTLLLRRRAPKAPPAQEPARETSAAKEPPQGDPE